MAPLRIEKAWHWREVVRFIEGLSPVPGQRVKAWDEQVKGLHLVVQPSGTKTWYHVCRSKQGKQHKACLGAFPNVRPVVARAKAEEHAKVIEEGRDPVAEQRAIREKAKAYAKAISEGRDPEAEERAAQHVDTLHDFAMREYFPHAKGTLKAGSYSWYLETYKRYLERTLGLMDLAKIARRDVKIFHESMRETPYAANRALAILRAILSYAAEDCEAIPANPASKIKRFKERARECRLTAEEMGKIVTAIAAEEARGGYSLDVLGAIRFLLFSGLRRNEALGLRWEWVDTDRKVVHFPESASKGGSRTLVLTPTLLGILAAQEKRRGPSNLCVFPGERADGMIGCIYGAWGVVRTAAGLPNLRLHDLRHNVATQGALLNLTAPMLKALMGHRDMQTTQRYIHVSGDLDPVHIAADALDAAMQEAIAGAAKVVEIGPRPAAGEKEAKEGDAS